MATWTDQTKNTTAWTNQNETVVSAHILLETGFNLLQENGFKLILEQSTGTKNVWTNQNRN